jgi:hypothetical protein
MLVMSVTGTLQDYASRSFLRHFAETALVPNQRSVQRAGASFARENTGNLHQYILEINDVDCYWHAS